MTTVLSSITTDQSDMTKGSPLSCGGRLHRVHMLIFLTYLLSVRDDYNFCETNGRQMDEISTRQDLVKFIEERCNEHWHERGHALLLTTLGTEAIQRLTDKGFLRTLGGLKKFIQANVPSVTVISHKNAAGKDGIVPKDADIPGNTDFLFFPIGSNPASAQSSERRSYHSGFWKAFKEPIAPGKVRVWLPSAPHAYTDLLEAAVKPAGSVAIPNKYILGIEGPILSADARKIKDRIESFISDTGADAASFINRQEQSVARKTESRQSLPGQLDNSEVFAAFLKLPRSDQARIAVPLDIVVDLLKSR